MRATSSSVAPITVRLPEPLREGAELLTISEPVASLADLIRVLEARLPNFRESRDELFNFAINGMIVLHGEKDVRLEPGDEVEIVVAFAGG